MASSIRLATKESLASFLSSLCATAPSDLPDLTQRIINEADSVKRDPQLVKRAVRDMLRRAKECINNGGRHVRVIHNRTSSQSNKLETV